MVEIASERALASQLPNTMPRGCWEEKARVGRSAAAPPNRADWVSTGSTVGSEGRQTCGFGPAGDARRRRAGRRPRQQGQDREPGSHAKILSRRKREIDFEGNIVCSRYFGRSRTGYAANHRCEHPQPARRPNPSADAQILATAAGAVHSRRQGPAGRASAQARGAPAVRGQLETLRKHSTPAFEPSNARPGRSRTTI